MFHWICPECGQEIPPRLTECPSCDPQAAPIPVESSPESNLASNPETGPQSSAPSGVDPVPEPNAGPALLETARPVESARSLEPSPEPEPSHGLDALLALAEQVRNAQLEYDLQTKSDQPEPAEPEPGDVETSRVESTAVESGERVESGTDHAHRAHEEPAPEAPVPSPGEGELAEPIPNLVELAAAVGLTIASTDWREREAEAQALLPVTRPLALLAQPQPVALLTPPDPVALVAEPPVIAPEPTPEPSFELTPPDPAPIDIDAITREIPAIERPRDLNQLELLQDSSNTAEDVASGQPQVADVNANHAEPPPALSEDPTEEIQVPPFAEACEPIALPAIEPVAASARSGIAGVPDDVNAGHLAAAVFAAIPGAPLLPATLPAEDPVEDKAPSGSWLPLAPLQDYSSAASRAMKPAVPASKILMPDSGPRITLPGPTLPPELASFQNAKILTARDAPGARKFGLPGLLRGFLLMLALLVAGMALAFYFLPVAHSNAETKSGVETAAPQPVSHPLAQFIEVTGFRIVLDFNKKSEIHYLVVNHSAAPVSDVTVYVTLRTDDARAGQPPLCRFSFRAPSLGPFESKEMTSSIEKLTRSVTLPDWQDLHADVQIAP
jgi:hypothetical protein